MRFDAGAIEWTEKVESNSRIIDPLGIWSHHLSIQEEFTAGIISSTGRARYYTIWAYYYEYLYRNKIIGAKDYEKLFILASLAHHDGYYDSPELRQMYNNQKFIGKWDEIQKFDLNFEIGGYGKNFYNPQMEVFRCAWTDQFGRVSLSKINSKLAKSLFFLNPEYFKKIVFTKNDLKDLFSGFCICQIAENPYEQDMLSKLMFGFFSEKDGDWDIDEDEFEKFMEGNSELTIRDRPNEPNHLQEYNQYHSIEQRNLRRRNSLLLFLKIVNETNPFQKSMVRFIWDAIYFKQNRENRYEISYGTLEGTRAYWEIHQLNIYYVFLLEKFLEQLQDVVIRNAGIKKSELIERRNYDYIYSYLEKVLGINIDGETCLEDIISQIIKMNGTSGKSSLDSKFNESISFDKISEPDHPVIFLSEFIIMVCLLYIRYYQISARLLPRSESNNNVLGTDQVDIDLLFSYIKSNRSNLKPILFLSDLSRVIVNRHLLASAQRFATNTKNWIFVEENGYIFSAREPIRRIRTRDTRWQSIRTLMKDLDFINLDEKSRLFVTEKGSNWLKKVK
jgi:hypothetical protein